MISSYLLGSNKNDCLHISQFVCPGSSLLARPAVAQPAIAQSAVRILTRLQRPRLQKGQINESQPNVAAFRLLSPVRARWMPCCRLMANMGLSFRISPRRWMTGLPTVKIRQTEPSYVRREVVLLRH